MSTPATTMQVKVRWSLSLVADRSRLDFAAMLTRPLYSSVVMMETFWSFRLTSRSPERPSPLSWREKQSAPVTYLSHMALASISNEKHTVFYFHAPIHAFYYEETDAWHCMCTQTGRGSDMISGCQTDSTILNLLTSTVTYIFPFSDQDVLCIHCSIVARDFQCFPIQADNRRQTADCEREKQRHNFQLV